MDRGRDVQREDAAKLIIRQLLKLKGAPLPVRELKRYFKNVNTSSICALIDEYPNNFERYDNEDGEHFVRLITNISLCQTHCSSKRTCSGQLPNCSGLHVCKFYILSDCTFAGTCSYGHDLTTAHNKRLLHQNLLEEASASDIRSLLSNADNKSDVLIPKVCKFYNVQAGCSRKKCSNLHVCKHYIHGECRFGIKCRRSHNLTEPTLLNILQNHGIDTKRSPKEILSELRGMMAKDKEDTESTGSSQAERLGLLTISDETDFVDRFDHVTQRQAKRSTSESRQNIPIRDQGARPKTTKANKQVPGNMMRAKSASVPNLQHSISTDRDMNRWICLYNLLGKCLFKQRCYNSHHDLPYQWCYRQKSSEQWKVFVDGSHNHDLEITFCDPQNAACFLEFEEGVIWDINFKTMTAKSGKYEVKRLSTKSSSEDERHPLATHWKWYWKDQMGDWKEYGEADRGYQSTILSGDIEQEYLARPGGQMVFATQGHEYILDFKEMVQKNIQYNTKREVVRRPEFVDKHTFEQKKRLANCGKKTKGDNAEGHGDDSTPTTWADVKGDLTDHYQIIQIDRKGNRREFAEVERLFFESMPNTFTITSIDRVENGDLWMSFLSKQTKMKKRNPSKEVKEFRLFHGTSSEYCDAICHQGFDFRLSGTSTGTLYGKGSYFAKTAKYSDAYAKSSDRLMFVVRVLVGEYTEGESKYVRPPSKDPSNACSDLYDSCVDDLDNPKVFVIFDNSQTISDASAADSF